MLTLVLATALIVSSESCTGGPTQPAPASPDSIARLYESGRPFAEFLRTATARRDAWIGNYAAVALDRPLLERARLVPGRWRLLAVLEDSCGDSANTIPWIAQLVDSLSNLELRIVNSREGRFVMERHRTPDGRAATPTVVLIDELGHERGCFIERPLALQAWISRNRGAKSPSELTEGKYAWYRTDAGRETVREVVELLESAALGTPRCQALGETGE